MTNLKNSTDAGEKQARGDGQHRAAQGPLDSMRKLLGYRKVQVVREKLLATVTATPETEVSSPLNFLLPLKALAGVPD